MGVEIFPSVALPKHCWKIKTAGMPDTYVRRILNTLICESETCPSLNGCTHVRQLKVWMKTNNNNGG